MLNNIVIDKENGSILIKGWVIRVAKTPILNSQELSELSKEIQIPFPEMFFGNNSLEITTPRKKTISFNAVDALKMVDVSKESADRIKVAISEKWTSSSLKNHNEIKNIIKPYDWTYTTFYKGTCEDMFAVGATGIDLQKLTEPDPILFYDEVLLFEDELGDNGTSILSVKIRVMPRNFLVLQRQFIRVDGVVAMIIDTRVYHEFGTNILVRDFQHKAISHSDLVTKLPFTPQGQDLAQLANINWIASVMNEKYLITHQLENHLIV
ncbi:hypothetical protein HDV06_002132 [Boothiomyces sp. JEL0866]|nr:hypothetical protein HDV06_002132 [Boothiomyces sp. JEL0866]